MVQTEDSQGNVLFLVTNRSDFSYDEIQNHFLHFQIYSGIRFNATLVISELTYIINLLMLKYSNYCGGGNLMITAIYFVRHAHSDYTADEWNRPLSARGWQDAKLITEILSNQSIDLIISSPYKRAIQTIEGLASQLSSGIMINDDFRERLLSDQPVDDFNQAISQVWSDPSFFYEGGESNIVAQQRGVNALNSILTQYNGKNIVISTHGNIMVLIMNYFDSQFDFAFWRKLAMPDIYRMTFTEHLLIKVDHIMQL